MTHRALSRRRFVSTALAAGAGLAMNTKLGTASPGKAPQSPANLKGKKVLFVWGGYEDHEPAKCRDVFVPWIKSQEADLKVYDTLDAYTDKDLMNSVDLVVQIWGIGTITGEQERGLLDAVLNGTGITGWHGGLCDAFRNNTDYQFMTGGQWVAHPGGIIDYRVNITNHKDPIMRGLSDFAMHSEQYYMHVDPNVKVLATTTFNDKYSYWIKDCVMPVVWKKQYGKGRVFYSSLGHVASDFQVPQAFEIMKRGILWASESKYAPPEPWINPVYD
jgi:type 1 glutamine amidotransferase